MPMDVFHRVLWHIPRDDTATLATLLRLSKNHCHAVAPNLYRHLSITAETDFLVDTGLPIDLISPFHTEECGAEGDNEDQKSGEAGNRSPPVGTRDGYLSDTSLKIRFLRLIRTIDIYPPQDRSSRATTHARDDKDGKVSSRVEHPLFPLPRRPSLSHRDPDGRMVRPLKVQQIRLRLDTASAIRQSPLSSQSEDGPVARLFDNTETERLVIHGASFTFGEDLTFNRAGHSFLVGVREYIFVITPGALPEPEAALSPWWHGLPLLFCAHHRLRRPAARITTGITFVLQTPNPTARFKVINLPHWNLSMTMEYHPDYAPGYLNGLTIRMAKVIFEDWSKSEVRRKTVSFVNFGAVDGEEVGMPQAAKETMEDVLSRGMRIRLEQEAGRSLLFQSEGWSLTDLQDSVKVLGMKEWLEGDKSREGILDEYIMAGWR